MASSEMPYKPGDEERGLYYFGLVGNPRLIARTSGDVWVKPQRLKNGWDPVLEQRGKCYGPIVEQDEIFAKWKREDLATSIIKILGSHTWSFFFPIRMILQSDKQDLFQHCDKRRVPDDEKEPVVLSIAVPADSMEWEVGIDLALQCRRLLQRHGLRLEVEIREGEVSDSAASSQLESAIDDAMWAQQPLTHEIVMPLLSYPGFPLTYLDDRTAWGTLGLYVSFGGSFGEKEDIYGLTCRHVVAGGESPEKSYDVLRSAKYQKQFHVQDVDYKIQSRVDQLKAWVKSTAGRMDDLRKKSQEWEMLRETEPEPDERKRFTDDDAAKLCVQKEEITYLGGVIENLEKILTSDMRVVGHLAAHPPLEVSSRLPGYLRDWALIKMDREKYPKGAPNKVYLSMYDEPVRGCLSGARFQAGFLELKPEEETVYLSHLGKCVAKVGGASGATLGIRSAIEAVVRRPTADGVFHSWELIVLSWERNGRFSERGDSGSAVFDEGGRVIGMITGRTSVKDGGWERERDDDTRNSETANVTFVAPIDWVLRDIENFVGCMPQIC